MSDRTTANFCDAIVTSVDCLVARDYECMVPSQLWMFDDYISASVTQVSGWLVGACYDRTWGWWGPVSEATAKYAVQLFNAINNRTPASPDLWAERARYSTRHAHAGVGAVAVGAIELAIWDLLGQRSGLPIWALLKDCAERRMVPAYASCLGYDCGSLSACETAQLVAGRGWSIQKWRPVFGPSAAQAANRLVELVTAEGGQVALDFCGAWPTALVGEYLTEVTANCAWVEEPVPPWRLMDISLLNGLPGPVAAGEHCYNPQDLLLLSVAGISIWQPDAVFCGGFSALRTCIRLAENQKARVIPHGGGLLPAVHAAAQEPLVECVEWHLSLEPRRQAHLSAPILPAIELAVPMAPGWGGPLISELRF